MEVSSERLFTNRLDALQFDITIFTNIAREHLDKHKTMDNYIESKCKLFKLVKKEGYCIINNDDKYSKYIKEASNGKVITYGINNKSKVMAGNIVIKENRLQFKMKLCNKKYKINSPLSGKYNVYNLMAACVACRLLGFKMNKIIHSIKKLKPISSRMESLDFGQPYKIIIDYAHTASSLKSSLEYINTIKKGKIITVTGSAGGRDKGKRPQMGEVVTSLSDYVIFTTDDPRFEDPNEIIDHLTLAIKDIRDNYERVIDRGEAIKKALLMVNKKDIVFIAGKGRDPYIVIGNEYVPYCDVDEIKKNISLF
jgi:UDP-N-acetylmuramoyl-L-alanyl-D-glutamate--2,6-diaminopimelate ligase